MKKNSRHSYVAFDWLKTCPKIIKKVCKRKNKSAKKLNKSAKKIKQVCKKANKSAKECIKSAKSKERID